MINQSVALAHTSVAEGSVLVFSPAEDTAAPVIRDAAEALAATSTDKSLTLIGILWQLLCLSLALGIATLWVPLWAALGGALAVGTVLALYSPSVLLSCWLIIVAASVPVVLLVPAGLTVSLPWLSVSAATAIAIMTAILFLLRRAGTRLCATAFSAALLCAPLTAWGASLTGPAVVIAAAILSLLIAPGLCTRAAGLTVPQLPAAGQSLAVADNTPAHTPPSRATRAVTLYEGVLLGTSFAIVAALLLLTAVYFLPLSSPPAVAAGWSRALCLCLGGAVLMHAARHGLALATWALMLVALSTVLAATVLCYTPDRSWSWWLSMAIIAGIWIAGMTAPLWARYLGRLEPTTVVWWERAEALALAATLPLAAHCGGLFLAIRGIAL